MVVVPKPLRWFVPSRDEIRDMHEDVKDEIGFRLRRLQNGEHVQDRNIKAFGEDERISHLVKIVTDGDDGNTYRTAVTVEFLEGIWVLGVFQKRSKSGIGTPKKDMDRIAARLGKLKAFRKTVAGIAMIFEMDAETELVRQKLSIQPATSSSRRTKGH